MEFLFALRDELLLCIFLLIIIIIKLITKEKSSYSYDLLLINILLGIFLALSFIPLSDASLFSGMYKTNATIHFQKQLLYTALILVSLLAFDWLKTSKNMYEVYFLLVSSVLGMNLILSGTNFLILFLGLELTTLPLVALVAIEKGNRNSAEAGMKIILNAAFSSAIMLFGIALIYGNNGSLDYSIIQQKISGDTVQVLAMILIFTGLAFKISVVPFHLWTADVYEGAPVFITAFLAVVSKSAVVLVLITVLFSIFNPMVIIWQWMLALLAVLTMTVGNLFALRQDNMKRFLAFSSIAQVGYILLGVISSSQQGMASVMYFLLIYIFSNMAAFSVVSAIFTATGKEKISDYKGLYNTNPRISILMLLAMFSLAGVPPAAGFFGKFFLLMAAAGKGFYVIVLIASINMIISLYYYLLVVKAMWIDTSENPIENFKSSFPVRTGMLICATGILIIGFFSFIYEYIFHLSFGI